ncbi:hypothetical protein BLNAU_18558 [Blattamonas nauphoetae]|uniref:Uncharacterized protein n=1 Tax=Blattamonas nauphoetae TaxID=2049346 RepID=A0ABQ9X411_9EUKA|nr:hypothetical protein BLNAU_18558 [Blattamonas nauphoetae]
MLNNLVQRCSAKVRQSLVEADLIPQVIPSLNLMSLSLIQADDIHINLMKIIAQSLWLATPEGFTSLKIKEGNEQQAAHEIILQQVVVPSEHCLTFFEKDSSIYWFLYAMINSQRKWNMEGGEDQQMRKDANRMLRMEGIDDVIEAKLRHDKNSCAQSLLVPPSVTCRAFEHHIDDVKRCCADALFGPLSAWAGFEATTTAGRAVDEEGTTG